MNALAPDSWQAVVRLGLSWALVLTAGTHFTSLRHDLVRMVPPWVPHPRAIIFFTGVCELLGAVGLLMPDLYRYAGLALVIFFMSVFPGDLYAARTGIRVAGLPIRLWWIIPMQLLFIGLTWWSTQ